MLINTFTLNQDISKQNLQLFTYIKLQQNRRKSLEIMQQVPIQQKTPIVLSKKQAEEFILFGEQVSGKTPKFTDQAKKYIYKQVSLKQKLLYQFMSQVGFYCPEYCLQKYIPIYAGTYQIDATKLLEQKSKIQSETCQRQQWINHIASRIESDRAKQKKQDQNKTYIKLQNLTRELKRPCIMDIKLGRKLKRKTYKKKYNYSTTATHGFRINGMCNVYKDDQNQSKQYEQHFISKYYFQNVSYAEIESHLAYFFFDGKKIDINLLTKSIDIIKDIIQALLVFEAGKFHSSSVLICYDGEQKQGDKTIIVKFIDFDQFQAGTHSGADLNVIEGLKNLLTYLVDALRNIEIHEKVIKAKQLALFHDNEVIPENIVKKYENTTANKEEEQKQTV